MMGELFYWNEDIKKIVNEKSVLIYGAGMMGNALYRCLSEEPYHKHVTGFIVNQKKNNPSCIGQVPVMDLEEGSAYKNCLILVALHDKHMDLALKTLKEREFTNLLPVTFDGDTWTYIRGNWLRNREKKLTPRYLDQVTEKKCSIYVAYSDRDKNLTEVPPLKRFEQSIQVGAALTQNKRFMVCDDVGENISLKNRKYCELTALYWIWKHDLTQYLGLSHYRRRFTMDENQIYELLETGFDLMVTVPIINFAGVKQQYALDHELSDWETMIDVIHEKYPEYDQAAQKVENGNYYYGYNMFIARREILHQYCKWLFTILEECENRIGEKQDSYQNRYIGFLSERLLTIFIEKNRDLRVIIADKHFVER